MIKNLLRQKFTADSLTSAKNRSRIDTFIIWGNGIEFTDKIIDKIRSDPTLEIIMIRSHLPKDINKFVKKIYQKDSVPYSHLLAKTKYLRGSRPEVCVVVVKNINPDEQLVGEGRFRQIQCMNIKRIKEEIRNSFNPQVDGKRTEEHVVHATDIESQTDHILKTVDPSLGLTIMKSKPNYILDAPYHIKPFNKFTIRRITFGNIYCQILFGDAETAQFKTVSVDETPHYEFVKGKMLPYTNYYNKYKKNYLTDDHTPESFKKMINGFSYLSEPFSSSYILLKVIEGKYIIQDGLHRASIARLESSSIIAAVVR